ncbi:MAG: hypothetical protein IJV06_09420 [Bacteroidaceae bacterium]|nr:hypothetical protein [Bacteroidaceae bacterium]
MKKTVLSLFLMASSIMAGAQQVVNVEYLNGDLDQDGLITTSDVTGLIDAYLEDELPAGVVSVTIDDSEVQARIADLQAVVAMLQSRQEDSEYKITVLKSDVAASEDRIAAIQAKVTTLESEMKDMEANAVKEEDLQAGLAAMKAYVMSDVQTLQVQIEDLRYWNNQIPGLTEAINNHEMYISELQQQNVSQREQIEELYKMNYDLQDRNTILMDTVNALRQMVTDQQDRIAVLEDIINRMAE